MFFIEWRPSDDRGHACPPSNLESSDPESPAPIRRSPSADHPSHLLTFPPSHVLTFSRSHFPTFTSSAHPHQRARAKRTQPAAKPRQVLSGKGVKRHAIPSFSPARPTTLIPSQISNLKSPISNPESAIPRPTPAKAPAPNEPKPPRTHSKCLVPMGLRTVSFSPSRPRAPAHADRSNNPHRF